MSLMIDIEIIILSRQSCIVLNDEIVGTRLDSKDLSAVKYTENLIGLSG
jgi:hypothetical protein